MTDKQTVKFGDICKEVKLTTKDPISKGYERYIGLEHLDSGSLKIKRWGIIADDNPSFTRVFKKGHILFGKRRPYLKKAAIAEFDGICSGDIIVMEPKLVNRELFPYVVQSDSFWHWAIQTSSGSLSPRTKYKSLAEYEFKLPNDKEQQRVVSVLTGITTAIDSIKISIESAQELKQSILAKLLLKGIGNKDFIDSKFGAYPSSWEMVTIGDVTQEHKQGFYATEKYTNEGCYLIRISDLDNPRVIFDEMPKVDVDTKTVEQFKVCKGDFLFARSGTIGRYGIYDSNEEAIFASYIIRFRFDESKILTSYFGYFYESILCARQLRGIAQQGSNVNINADNIKKLRIPLPSIDEQKEILKVITDIDLLIEELNNKKAKTELLIRTLSNEMIGG
ncbi:restriction endonuclease subunit S [Vibrio anguillarum]|uniref:restriction endonuclease subunit S n=3 Tax=Vibrio anguillarum TaxID=55601 RepID=UPI00188DB274|nr:restriction endonuclease subunit S [Vibrio anguillarum]MBF4278799.1 restriction endonuclease subunit S [Vibrio anguillarum]MBF4360838.1 restriction endonuclease subunit S [Vibrio anguillarum]